MSAPELALRFVAHSDMGLRRANNEDSGYASDRLLIVADGMGGAAAGEIASAETVETLRRLDRDDWSESALDELQTSVTSANARLAQIIADDPGVEGMGTTLEVLVWDGEKLAWAHIGDSRVYRLREGKLTQLSTDHTLVQSLVEEGRITPDEARVHPHRSLILRAMLGRDDNEADLSWLQPAAGDRFLLCSDGLSDMISADMIEQDLRSATIDVAAVELVNHALEAGGYDNITVVIGEFVPADTPLAENLSCADGRHQLVGAVAESPQDRRASAATVANTTTLPAGVPDEAIITDPEELRYAARPPTRGRWWRLLIAASLIIAALVGAGAWAYDWSQKQYYVSDDAGTVAIFRGVPLTIPGIELSEVDEATTISLDSLPRFQRDRVTSGIDASSRAQAEQIIEELRNNVLVTDPESTTESTTGPTTESTTGPTPSTPTETVP